MPRSKRFAERVIVWAGLVVTLAAVDTCASAAPAEGDEKPDLLVVVNGDSITTADLDAEIIAVHTRMGDEDRARFHYPRLLDKLVNDRLLIQEAEAIGIDEEDRVAATLNRETEKLAVQTYIKENFTPPDSAGESAVRAYFSRFYWKVQFRQVSVPDKGEAAALRQAVRRGAKMDSIARAVSVDPMKMQGGLHKLRYFADTPLEFRPHLEGKPVGTISDLFHLREAYTFIRVEDKTGPDNEAYPKYKKRIRAHLTIEATQQKYEAWIQALRERARITIDDMALATIRKDEEILYRGEFLKESMRAVVRGSGIDPITEGELRREISHRAMRSGGAPFDSVLMLALDTKIEQRLFVAEARKAGAFEHPEVLREITAKRDRLLLEAYLEEMIVPKIVFKRKEFEDYYKARKAEYQKPDEYLLGSIVVHDEAEAREVSDRLRKGADFDFIRKKHNPGDSEHEGRDNWSPLDIFSDEIQAALKDLKVGESSVPINYSIGWIVFHVKGKRPGGHHAMEEVEDQIREVMFQKKFNELLDQHLAKLKKHSTIRRDEAAISSYFGS